ncbi:MAG TPA: arginase family protein, partial [Dehalococcoidia bacterium]
MVFDRMPADPAFVGIPTFLKLPYVQTPEQLAQERPDAVILGAPFDMGVVNRPGARYGPRAIRQASNLGRAIYHLELAVQPRRTLRVFDYGDAS